MKQFRHLATLIAVGALVAPLASQAAEDKDADRHAPKVWVKDSAITAKIKTQLATSKPSTLAKVHVDTDANGQVQLTGKVDTEADKDRAESIVRTVKGVQSVDNQLMVDGK